MTNFKNKNILITGGTKGIGLAGALELEKMGANLFILGSSKSRLDKTAQIIPRSQTFLEDLRSTDIGTETFNALNRQNIKLDGLWLNAGVATVQTVTEFTADIFDSIFATNVRGHLLLLSKLISLINEGGSIVFTASTGAYEGTPAATLYAASKSAIIGSVRCLAAQLAQSNIRVNTLVPGAISTEFRHFMSDEFKINFESHVLNKTLLKRIGTANEAAAVAIFLLSDAASYVTGSQFFVDGGLRLY